MDRHSKFLIGIILLLFFALASPVRAAEFNGERDIAMLAAGTVSVSLLVLMVWSAVTDDVGKERTPQEEVNPKKEDLDLESTSRIFPRLSLSLSLSQDWHDEFLLVDSGVQP